MHFPANRCQKYLFSGLEQEAPAITNWRIRPLRFVTLLHDASSLHYDFRLELLSMLKSWVLPDGPSIRAGERRYAKRVNDHGLSSLRDGAERVILPGNYGAGTVQIWDRGNFYLHGVASRKDTIAAMNIGLEKGILQLILEGERLKGAFNLIREESHHWFLIKQQGEFASDVDITLHSRSVVTNRTLAEIAASDGWWTRAKK